MSEFSKHIAAAKAKGWHQGARRMEMERRMASALVKAILKRGYSITVDNGEDLSIEKSTSYRAVMDALWATDEERVVLYDAAGKRHGWFYLVYGNDGWDLVSDYIVNDDTDAIWDEISKVSDKLQEDY